MRALLCLIAAAALAAPAAAATGRQADPPSPFTLSLSLDSDRVARDQRVAGEIRLRNTSGRKLHLLLQEKDIYGRPLAYPAELRVRVVDASGAVLTASERTPDGWWSANELLNPHLLVRDARQRVELKPRGEISRSFVLGDVLAGSAALGAGFPPGRYVVQVAVNGVASNEVELEVVAP